MANSFRENAVHHGAKVWWHEMRPDTFVLAVQRLKEQNEIVGRQ